MRESISFYIFDIFNYIFIFFLTKTWKEIEKKKREKKKKNNIIFPEFEGISLPFYIFEFLFPHLIGEGY